MKFECANWDSIWSRGFKYDHLDGWAREIFLEIGSLLKDHDAPSVLSAGCGRALVDYWILQAFGWNVTLMDNSAKCVSNLKRSFRRFEGDKCLISNGSIFNIPFPDKSFDMVWNAGVLEHFSTDEYFRSLGEMVRVSRRYVLVAVPNSACKPYMLVKEWLESNGKWVWGYELPRSSIRGDLESLGVLVVKEQAIGGPKTIQNYLEMLPSVARGEVLAQLSPCDYDEFPLLLTIGTVGDNS